MARSRPGTPPLDISGDWTMTEATLAAEGRAFAMEVAVIVVGGGGTGLCAALAAADAGAEVLVIERDRSLLGSTAMSTGLIPAAGTPEQAAAGIEDSPEIFAADILKKTKGRTDPDIALGIARESAATIAWRSEERRVGKERVRTCRTRV